jgi:ketosteroid isomerase-like protein|tara:strand:- start:8 stop:511 length:504 start_codon:yes stop_codon:yes gene_type:complete
MKNLLLLSLFLILSSCNNKPIKSQKEILTETTKATVLKAFNAQMAGEIEVMKSQLAEEFTFVLTGQLDISKTYSWDEFLEFAGYFGTLLTGDVGGEYKGIIVEGKTAIVFAEGRMEGIGGKYENDYAIKYTLNDDGKIIEQKEYLSDLLLAQKLYDQDLCGEKKTIE